MNILYDHQVFLAQRYGGVSRYFVELIRRLGSRPGCSITVFAGFHRNALLAEAAPGLPARVIGHYLPGAVAIARRPLTALNQAWLRQVARDAAPDLYHPTYYKALLRDLPAARVVTVYDMTHEIFPELFPGDDPTPGRKRSAVSAASRVICISDNTRHDVQRLLGVPNGRLATVHISGAPAGRARPERPLPDPYLLYVGARGGYKNADLLVRAWSSTAELRNRHHLVFFGGEPAAREEHADPRIHFVAGDDDDLATWYTHAHAFVYPSRYEGFGLPPLEAMQCGCPVVASSASSLPEVVGDAGLLFPADDAAGLVRALLSLDRDPGLRESLRQKGQARCRHFSWDRCADETWRVYEQARSDEPPGSSSWST